MSTTFSTCKQIVLFCAFSLFIFLLMILRMDTVSTVHISDYFFNKNKTDAFGEKNGGKSYETMQWNTDFIIVDTCTYVYKYYI